MSIYKGTENTEHNSLSISYEYAGLENIKVADGTLEYIWHTRKKDLTTLQQSMDSYDKHEFKKKLSEDEIKLFEKWIEDCDVFILPKEYQRGDGTSYSSTFVTGFAVRYGEKIYNTGWSGDDTVPEKITTAVQALKDITNEIKDNSEKPWGQAVEGAQIRLVDAKQIWGSSDWTHAVVQLQLEAENNGQRYLHLPENGLRCQIEVDGIWYEYVRHEKGPDGIEFGAGSVLRDFNQGNSYGDLKVEIADSWRKIPDGKEIEYAMRQYSGSGWVSTGNDYGTELILKSGKHTIRTAITCPPSKRINIIDSPVRLISNPIEFEVWPNEEDEIEWGEAIEDIQIRVRMDQQFHEGQIPKFLMDVRNNGPEDLRLVLAPEWWELELDGLWYKVGTWYSGIVPVMSLDSGEQKNGIEFVPTERCEWQNNRNPLKFLEGTHEVRLSFTVFRKDPNDRHSTQVLSNPIEFEVLPGIKKSEAESDINVPEIEPLSSSKSSDISERLIKGEEIDLNLIYELLNGPQAGRRLLSALYLATHGDSNSIPYLIDALSDGASVAGIDFIDNSDLRMNSVRYWANDSLKKLTGLDVGFVWNDPIEKRNKAIQKWKYWWEKNESTFQVINNNDREEIENIVESLWQAVDANDTKKVSPLYYDKIIDNNDSNTNGLIHGLLKDKEQVERQKGNDIAGISNIVIKNSRAIAVTKPNIEALFIYYFVKPDDKWFLYYTQRRTNFSKIIDLEPSIAINDLFNDWPRTKLDNEAFITYLEVGELLYNGTDREEVAKKFESIGKLYPLTDRGKICTELGKLLDEMVQEDKKFVEPQDIERLSEKEKIDYYIYKLRDVAEQEFTIPGKCYVLRFPRTTDSAAVALRNMGSVVISSMISLLEDRRPTRSVGLSLNGGVVLRYCDIALEIIADIAGQNNPNETTIFDPRTQRGAYLSSADEKTAREIIDRAKLWWEQNKDKYDLSSDIR